MTQRSIPPRSGEAAPPEARSAPEGLLPDSRLRTSAPRFPRASCALVSLVKKQVGPLSYRVPEELSDEVQVGVRVRVPLGRARAVGYLIALQDAPPQGVSPESLREILEVLDADPILAPSPLALARFAARYYHSPIAEALRLLHPAGMELVERRRLALTDSGRLALRRAEQVLQVQGLELTGPEAQVLRLLAQGPADTTRLRKRAPGTTPQALRRLQRRGLVEEVSADYTERVRPVTETVVSLCDPPPTAETLAALSARAPVQGRLLGYLADHAGGQPIPVAALRPLTRAPLPPLRALEAKGLVSLSRRERVRDPFAAIPVRPHPPPELTVDQAHALAVLSAALRARRFEGFLLHGVTSSGKTEVYLRIIREALDAGKGAIVLVPEISLTPQLAARFRARFPEGVAVLHSGLGSGQREDAWRRVRRGQVRLVVGARSALFAPVENLGVLVVDEEHDGSFKQEEGLRYHARDLALVRGQREGALVVLGSATPSLEAFHNAEAGRLRLLSMPERATPQPLPDVQIVDLKQYQTDAQGVLTAPLAEAITDTLAQRQQVILFLNRRGFAPFVLCPDCGEALRCPDCSVSLTWHKRSRRMRCHYCGFERRLPDHCPSCSGDRLRPLGLGTERVEETLRARFPGARVARLDRDTARGTRLQATLDATAAGEIDILVGTQMVTKGHDFPGVTLVGVIQADHALHLPDFRSAERTFQLLTQVAGRAGRGGAAGRVLVQTFNPEHHAIAAAAAHDYLGFYKVESRLRRELGYPPFGHLAALRVQGPDEAAVVTLARRVGTLCHALGRRHQRSPRSHVAVLGPAEAPIAKIRGRFRWHVLLKSADRSALHQVLDGVEEALRGPDKEDVPAETRVILDVDPQSML